MVHDKVKFCWTCQQIKPRDEVLEVSPGSRRKACLQCRMKREEAHREIARRAGKCNAVATLDAKRK